MTARAFVLGGGVAGIAAAFHAKDLGYAVTVVESHRWLGGRAFSRQDDRLGVEIDNGPHVVLGCYTEFRALLRRIGTEQLFERQPTLTLRLREVGGRLCELRLPGGAPKLGLGLAALRFAGMGFVARLRLLRGAVAALLAGREDESLDAWLVRHRQHGDPRRFFWDPLCRAVANAPAAAVSARLFLATLLRALSQGCAGAAIWFPRAGWSRVLGEPAASALSSEGVEVRVATRVVRIEVESERVRRVLLGDDSALALGSQDAVVCALPWHQVAKVLGDRAPARMQEVPGSAITTVHFAGLRLPDDGPLVGLVDGDPFHFVCRQPGGGADRIALLASGDFPGSTEVDAAIRLARAQLARTYPGWDTNAGVARVVRMPMATAVFGPSAAQARFAPGRHPTVANLWICGDATATGVPSTLEGAALSARAVAAGSRGLPPVPRH